MPRSTAPQPDFAEPPSPWTRPGFLIAAAVVALIVIAGLIIAVTGTGGTQDPAPPAATGSAAPPDGPAEPAALPTSIPTVAPKDVTWQLVGQSAVPVSRSAGPRTVTDTTASGFAHSPEGALIAAAQLATRVASLSGKKYWEPTITKQFVPSKDRDQLLAALRAEPEQDTQPGDLSPLVGYIYQSYTPDTAVIGLVYRSASGGRYFVVNTTVVWRGGDWQMVAPPGGSWVSVNRPTSDLTGVVEWGAR